MAITDLRDASAHGIANALFSLFAIKGGYLELVLAAGLTLDVTHPFITALDPGGAGRTIVLDGTTAGPGEASHHGMFRLIVNKADAAENLTVNDADGTTIVTINQDESALLYQDEDSGWGVVFVFATALT